MRRVKIYTYRYIKKLAEKINCPLNENDIDYVSRSALRSDGKTSNVILAMTTRNMKEKFLKELKTRDNRKLLVNQDSTSIFFNDHLTMENKILYKEARAKAKKENFRYTWTKSGKIFLREKENSKVIRIRSVADVELIQSTCTTSSVKQLAR
jgi:hypothetical protein